MIAVVLIGIGNKYAQRITVNQTPRQVLPGQQSFAVNRVRISNLDTGDSVEVFSSGLATKTENQKNTIKARKFFTNEDLATLFNTLTLQEFQNLLQHYYGANRNLVIIIETTFGTKTIIINQEGNNPPPPGPIETIIEETEEIEDKLDDPTPTPPPLPPPTPTPAGATPAPTPTGFYQPDPSPTPLNASPVPFSCDMLDRQNVTVSNIRCIDPSPTPRI